MRLIIKRQQKKEVNKKSLVSNIIALVLAFALIQVALFVVDREEDVLGSLEYPAYAANCKSSGCTGYQNGSGGCVWRSYCYSSEFECPHTSGLCCDRGSCDTCNPCSGHYQSSSNGCTLTPTSCTRFDCYSSCGTTSGSCYPVKYNVTYVANGGSCPGVTGVCYNTANAAPNCTRTGYSVSYTQSGCGGTFNASTGVCSNITQATTITANWTASSHTVTVNGNGGTCSPGTHTVPSGSASTAQSCSRNGYTLSSFSQSGCGGTFNAGTGVCSKVTQATTITANWTASVQYTVTVNANGGSCSPGTHSVFSGNASSVQSCSRTSYVLSSFSQSGCGGTFDSSTGVCSSVTQAMSITANWSAVTLSAPLNLVATYGDGKVSLGWKPPISGGHSVTDYIVQYSTNGGSSWTVFNDGVSPNPLATVTGLTNNQQHTFRVAAKNAAGTGSYSSTVQSTPQVLAITSLSSTSGLFLGGGSLTINATGLGDTQKFSEISPAGDGHTCGLAIDGEGYCWGRNNSGQLGSGTTISSSLPVSVLRGSRPVGVTFTRINAGRYHACGIGSNGQGYCWGYNASGQVGNGSTNPAYVPALVSQGARPSGGTFTDISAGGYYSCGVGNNGQAYCWGANGNMQLGDGTTTQRTTPVLVIQGARPSNVTYVSVDTGHQHTCGVGSNGNGYCWGEGAHGRLGNGGTTTSGSPVLVSKGARPTGVTFTKISGGGEHTCGIGSNGQAYCWGRNNYGQLGNGNTGTDSSTPVLVSQGARGSGVTFTSIDARYNYTCAVGSDGNGYCWGLNADYQFGNGGTGNSNVPALVSQGARPAGVTFNNIGAGGNQTCAVGSDGNGYCWGNNTDGHLGDGTTTNRSTPVLVKLLAQYGYQINIGNNTLAQTILPESTSITVDPMPAHAAGMASVSLKRTYDNATSNNVNYTYNNLSGPDITSISPSTVPPNTSRTFSLTGTDFLNYGPINLTSISTGNYHTCGVDSNGDGYCWGEGTYGKLGNGNTTNRSTPVLVNQGARPAGVTFSDISAGENHTCGVGSNGRGYCWGYNPYGQLGNSNTGTNSSVPVLVSAGAMGSSVTFSSISVGENHSCGVGSDGKGYCWGRNGSGQLGNGNTNDSNIPVLVSSGTITFSSISAGRYHTCGIASNGNGYCWGNGGNGRLGNGGTANSSVPVLVNQGERQSGVTFTSMTLGPRAQHSCAVGSDGNGFCWGYNGQGQLGNNSTTDSSAPVLVSQGARPGGTTFSSIAGGGNHTCGLSSNGRGYCWGSNWYGRLGDGTTNDSAVPVLVSLGIHSDGKSFVSVIGGVFHSCGILSNGRALCWGQNSVGNLGTNDQLDRPTPAYVLIVKNPTIEFNYIVATSTTYTSTTAMSAVSPVLRAGTIVVKLTNPDGQFDTYNIFAGDAPSAPLNLVATYGDGQVSLGWKKPLDEGGGLSDYHIEYSNDGGNTWVIVLNGSTNTFTTVTGLTNNYLYTFRVAAVNPLGTGPYSSTVESTPRALAITSVSPTSGTYLGGGTMTIEATGLGDYQKFTQISTGSYYHTCGVATDGEGYCWGYNNYGQLGNGNTGTNSNVPVLVSQGDRPAGVTFSSIGMGYYHSCGLGSDGNGYCWGYNNYGQLGNGNTGTNSNVPVLVGQGDRPASVTFSSISVGNYYSCGLGGDGNGYCWGYNYYGQLGNGNSGSSANSNLPVLVSQGARPANVTFSSISAGSNHTCGVGSDGEGYCWGYNYNGQLGNGSSGSSANSILPVLVSQGARPANVTFSSISVSSSHTCGLGSDGNGYCWGNGANGRLGDGYITQRTTPVLVSQGARPANVTFSSISAGNMHSCGVGSNGNGYCWGYNYYGRLGNGSTTQSTIPVLVNQGARPAGVTFNTISAGNTHTCGVGSDGQGYCWGYNSYGQLGDNSTTQRTTPVLVSFFTSYEYQIAIGNNTLTQFIAPGSTNITVTPIPAHVVDDVSVSLTRVYDNRVSNNAGYTYANLPPPDITSISPSTITSLGGITVSLAGINFLDYAPMNTFSDVSAGNSHTCGTDSSGNGYCWGFNINGELGNNSTTNSSIPVLVSQGARPGGVTFSSISAGSGSTCAVGSNGAGYCWGDNEVGQLGNGSTGTYSTAPVLVNQGARSSGVTFQSISTGGWPDDLETNYAHTCGVGSDGNGYCWGDNSFGQLGNSSTTNSGEPVLVSQGARGASVTFVNISAGDNHTCGVGSDGNGYCWGYNYNGQLGNGASGSGVYSTEPVLVTKPAGITFVSISAGGAHTCGVGSDGNGYCWGNNGNGRLGNGSTTQSTTPVLVSQGARPAGVTFSSISAGNNHTCGAGSDGNGYCWGDNYYGELGSGGVTGLGAYSDVPVLVNRGARPSSVILNDIDTGGTHTCAVGNSGAGYCWGSNSEGRLGNNETTNRTTMSYILKKEIPTIHFATEPASSTTYTSTIAMSAVSPQLTTSGTVPVKLTNPDGQYDTYNITVQAPPSVPLNLTATAGNKQVSLSWNTPNSDGGVSITDYIVQYSTDGNTWTIFNDGVSTSTSATVTGLTNGTLYYFQVAAINSIGTGPYTNSVTATPVNQAPIFTGMQTVPPATVNPGTTITWKATASDSDGQVKLLVCKTQAISNGACVGGEWCSSSFVGSNPSCSIAPTPIAAGLYKSYVYIIDNDGAQATGTYQSKEYTFTVNDVTPTVTNVVLNEGYDITLEENTTKSVTLTAQVVSANTCSSINTVKGYIYRSDIGYSGCDTSGEANGNHCYPEITCTLNVDSCTDPTASSANYTCTADIQFFADPTDANVQYSAQTWLASVSAKSGSSTPGAGHLTTGVEMNSLLGITVTPSLDYGNMLAGWASTPYLNRVITSVPTGNIPMNQTHKGEGAGMCTTFSMSPPTCGGSTPISHGAQKYSLNSTTPYDSGTPLTDTAASVLIDIPKATSTSPTGKSVWWGIKIPDTVAIGQYNGLVSVTPTKKNI